MKKFTLCGCILAALAACQIVCSPLGAQQITASITGTVADTGGAVINGATVTVTDVDRGTTYEAKTLDGGIFTFARLPIGTYDVKVEAQGFETSIQSHVTLVLNQTARLDFKMKVGAVTNTVRVTSEAPPLQTETTQVSTLVDSRAVTNIPLATRNYVVRSVAFAPAVSGSKFTTTRLLNRPSSLACSSVKAVPELAITL